VFTTIRSPKVILAYDKVLGLLDEAGVPPGRAMAYITACESFVIGSALDLAAPEVMWEIPADVEAPRLAEALARQESPAHRADSAFELGLRALLNTLTTGDSPARTDGGTSCARS